ncbi:Probable phospholipid hydroperoxide glutathione peroxidase [Ancistrocladus abbreviatus]
MESSNSTADSSKPTMDPSNYIIDCPISTTDPSKPRKYRPRSIHEFVVKDYQGNDVDLSTYAGKTLLVVNVSTHCALAESNYTELAQLYEVYKDKGLEILAFPCDQFHHEGPETNEQIVEFARSQFNCQFPFMDKVEVTGKNIAPIYKFLKSGRGGQFRYNLQSNFSKFLVNRDGKVINRYAPLTWPSFIEKDIKKLLRIE